MNATPKHEAFQIVGPELSAEAMADIIRRLRHEHPDVAIAFGKLPDAEQTALADILTELRKITAPPKMHLHFSPAVTAEDAMPGPGRITRLTGDSTTKGSVADETEDTTGPLTEAVKQAQESADAAVAESAKAFDEARRAHAAATGAHRRLDTLDSLEQHPPIKLGTISASRISGHTITSASLISKPPARAVPYLGTLVVDLPGNSAAIVLGGTYAEAAYGYRDIAASIELNHPDEIVRVVRTNGNEHTVLRNGTVLRPARPTPAVATERAAELVIISGYTREYTSALHHRATHAAAPKAGRIVSTSDIETSAS